MEIKGYHTATGYMGYIDGEYRLFASEADYLDYVAELLVDIREN